MCTASHVVFLIGFCVGAQGVELTTCWLLMFPNESNDQLEFGRVTSLLAFSEIDTLASRRSPAFIPEGTVKVSVHAFPLVQGYVEF